MAQQFTVQACFLAYVFSFALTSLIWLVHRDEADRVPLRFEAE